MKRRFQMEKRIEKIIENFDFEKMLGIMLLLDWKWQGEYPTVERIQEQARSLLQDVVKQGRGSSETGGLVASYFINEIGD